MKVLFCTTSTLFAITAVCWCYLDAIDNAGEEEEVQCGLYMAHGDGEDGAPLLFAGKNYKAHQQIGEEELVVPIPDANKNEYSPWHDFVWGDYILPREIVQEADFSQDVFVSGVGSMVACSSSMSSTRPNIAFSDKAFLGKGAVSDYHNFTAYAINDVEAGEVLLIDCNDNVEDGDDGGDPPEKMMKSLEWLKANGVCVDNSLSVRQSTITGAGRGAFAKHFVPAGDVIATSPVIHMDRSQTEIVKQEYKETDHKIPLFRDHGIEYTSQVIGQQLMLIYLYGHPDSNVLLLPFAPGVNFINHHHESPNAVIRWSTTFVGDEDDDARSLREEMTVMQLLELGAGELFVDFVALRDIQSGDEIFIDYGDEYETAWKEHSDKEDALFRHEIGVPDNFYPDNWMKADPMPYGDFIASPLTPGQMAPIQWSESNEVVTPWAFRLGLHSRVREVLLEYCNTMGITDILKHVTVEGNGLEPGTETHMEVEGDDWYLQRPESEWRSNLHWFSPGGAPAHEHYLQALSVAGFDEILDGIGKSLGMDGLVAFHVTFIGVSFSNQGYLHHDVAEVGGGRVFNVIIPLILANDTGPELDLQEWRPDLPDEEQAYRVGRYRYEYDVASMMGDGAVHATSAVDYRINKQMRMAATVYIADVNEENVHNILNHYTQAYPPDDVDLLMSWKGRHWKKDDVSRKLPKPSPDHILLRIPKLAVSKKTTASKTNEKESENVLPASDEF